MERSIVNRVFTVDRQMGLGFRGRLFEGTGADLRYYAGAFTGEGRGVSNDDQELMYISRLQWNFLGRDLALRQTDVERTEKPTGSLAPWRGHPQGQGHPLVLERGGNLDGFDSVSNALDGQRTKCSKGSRNSRTSTRASRPRTSTTGRTSRTPWLVMTATSRLLLPGRILLQRDVRLVPGGIELAARYAWLEEPNETDIDLYNERQEYTLGANWFFNGHNNKLSLDFSHLTLDDAEAGADESANRVRLQWDVSF